MSTQELFDLSNDVAVVTGAGRGIGEGIAKVLAEAGASVVLAARRTDEIDRVAKEINELGQKAVAVTTDVTDDEQVEALAQAAIENFGKLSIWVNNAGGSPVARRLVKLTKEDWDHCLKLNLTSIWSCTVIAARHLEEGGRVINISSKAAWGPMPGSGHYAAAKAGVNSLTETFAREMAPRIRVNGIAPGVVPTEVMMQALRLDDSDVPELSDRMQIPMGRVGTPRDLGAAALYLASPASSWVTGQTIIVTGGM